MPEPLGDQLTNYELALYEYSTFSLCEEIDLHYCKKVLKNELKFKDEKQLKYKI